MKIGLDAMGGDYAPDVVIEGACIAAPMLGSDATVVLFGDQASIKEKLESLNADMSKFEIVGTTEVIDMADSPAQAFLQKKDSSISVGFKYLTEGKIDGFASAGSTGAMLVGSMYTVKPIKGVIRPVISTPIPTIFDDRDTLLLDIGLNVDCKPEVLYQYGMIGSVYASAVMGIENPRVALLNIGEEKEKGNAQTKAAYALMDGTTEFNFVGNLESKEIFTGAADVIVCDGFTGNTILKQAEGVYTALKDMEMPRLITDFNYENHGGTPVLGLNSTVIIGHGCSSAKAIMNMVLQTEKAISTHLVEKIREKFSHEEI